MVQPLSDARSIWKNDYQVAVVALFLSPRTVPSVSVCGSDHHFQDQLLHAKRYYLIVLHLVVGVSSSVWWFKNGNWCLHLYLSHAMLVLADLIVCSTRALACILAKWFWPTVMSLALTYGSLEASCIKQAGKYFGR